MPRELPDYRNPIEQLNMLFPGRELLTVPEVMQITGYKSRSSIYKFFSVVNGRVNKATLARRFTVPRQCAAVGV